MKILVLHGYGQTVAILQKRAGKLFERLRREGHHLIFPEASISVQLFDTAGKVRQEGRAWFTFNSEDPNDVTKLSSSEPTEWLGLKQSLDSLQEFKCDAVIGFSQGAVIGACLATTSVFKCCIFFSGFLSPPPTN